MCVPGSEQDHDGHYHDNAHRHAVAVSGDRVLISRGVFTINQVYSLPPVDSQRQVLAILCPPAGPSRIDGRLLHDSSEYENIQRLRGLQYIPNKAQVHSRQIFQEVTNHLPKRGALQHGSSHYTQQGSSKHVSIPVAAHLTRQGNLLATIILPDSTPPCTKFIVTTLVYQLVQNIPSSAEYVLAALQKDPGIFERNTETQFRELVKIPLETACINATSAEKEDWPNTIVLDGNARDFSPGSVADWILQSLSALPVNTITLIEGRSQDRDLVPTPYSLIQRVRKMVQLLIHSLGP